MIDDTALEEIAAQNDIRVNHRGPRGRKNGAFKAAFRGKKLSHLFSRVKAAETRKKNAEQK
jgi:hypothetical protein